MREVNEMMVEKYGGAGEVVVRRRGDTRPATPTSQSEAFYLRGQIFEKKGDYSLAIRDYQHALEINPSLINAAYAKAACLNKLGNFEDAINTYNQAFALETPEFSILDNLEKQPAAPQAFLAAQVNLYSTQVSSNSS